MNGERKMPTITLIPRADQLEPTFFRICLFSSLSMNDGGSPAADDDLYFAQIAKLVMRRSLKIFFPEIIASLSILVLAKPLLPSVHKHLRERCVPTPAGAGKA